jgi:hypothetical protein
VFGTMTNNLLIGYTKQDESRAQINLFPFVVIGAGDGSALTSFGSEPFTPFNLLFYHTFQVQDSVTMFKKNHSITFGGNLEKFHSDNSFYFGIQSAYSYNTLADFYADANSYLANPNRTVSPVQLSIFQVKYLLQPGQTTPPLQPLDVTYWRRLHPGRVAAEGEPDGDGRPARRRAEVRQHGVQQPGRQCPDVSRPGWLAGPVQQRRAAGDDAVLVAACRRELGRTGDGATQVRGGTGLFSGKPPYVWISNQIGNTGVLYGFAQTNNTTAFPFNPSPDRYKPAPTGGAAASYELDVTGPGLPLPADLALEHRRRSPAAVGLDRHARLHLQPRCQRAGLPQRQPAGGEFRLYRRRQPSAVGRNRHVAGMRCDRECRRLLPAPEQHARQPGDGGLRHQEPERELVAEHLGRADEEPHARLLAQGRVQLRRLEEHGRALVHGSHLVGIGKSDRVRPEQPGARLLGQFTGKRIFLAASYGAQWFKFGTTTFSMFYDGHTNGNTSYVFAGDANGDTQTNDLIYIPRDTAEMNFRPLTVAHGRTYTAAEQAAAFEQLIQSDKYMRSRRGQYAERNAVFLPLVHRTDFSISQDLFANVKGRRHSGQIRLDVTNFTNLLNSDWGVGRRVVNTQILTSPQADANGRLSYNLQTLSGNLITNSLQTSANIASIPSQASDVYIMMLSFRYTFQ